MAAENKPKRLSKIAKEFNLGIQTIVEFLEKHGVEVNSNPNAKVPPECYSLLLNEFGDEKTVKEKSKEVSKQIKERHQQNTGVQEEEEAKASETANKTDDEDDVVRIKDVGSSQKEEGTSTEEKKPASATKAQAEKKEEKEAEKSETTDDKKQDKAPEKPKTKPPKVLATVNLDEIGKKKPAKKEEDTEKKTEKKAPGKEETAKEKEPEKEKKDDFVETKVKKLSGPTVVGKIDIQDYVKQQEREKEREKAKKEAKAEKQKQEKRKKKRRRIKKERVDIHADGDKSKKRSKRKRKTTKKEEVSEEEVQKQIKETLKRLEGRKQKSKAAKYRKEKRSAIHKKQQEEEERQEQEKHVLEITEFVSVNELAQLMEVPVTDVIATCMNMGLQVSINQRLDAENMTIIADEYDYEINFVSADDLDDIEEDTDSEEELEPRSPIVTVMGHVDHGKTKLLDHIRSENVVAGEAGGITQHIGAYSVKVQDDKYITFLDTPGHEAFTAMRARGAQVTDIAIIVIAADDDVMPQTKEAINHASAAGVPIVFAINKIDKPNANPEKIKEKLAQMNYLVEEWGGKYQSQDISAKQGTNIQELLEKVLFQAEIEELKANPEKMASGTIIESSLDRGRGYVTTMLVQNGTLKHGDFVLTGSYSGRIKAMYNERNKQVKETCPATPVIILGLNGAPQAGDKFNAMEDEHEAKQIANKRMQLQREQSLRTQKHITLDEIGRRIALGNFQEVNVVVKGDVDGSIEALSDSLIKLSTEEIQVNVIHKGVGQITETDVMLAAASNAFIVGFQVRPSVSARKIAEKEEIEIRLYSIIYDAINELKDAMEGMIQPEIKEKITGTAEIQETFKITKVGTVAGCKVTDGKIHRNHKIRLIRDGIVVYTGDLGSLKRYKDDVKEVSSGYECGLNIKNYNDIKVGDLVEAFEEVEVKRKL